MIRQNYIVTKGGKTLTNLRRLHSTIFTDMTPDGVAPRAKMNQQRSRRFRSAQEAKEKDEDKEEFLKMLKSQNGGVVQEGAESMIKKKTWDSNAITPGTPFMHLLAACLRYWCAYKINTDPAWEKVLQLYYLG